MSARRLLVELLAATRITPLLRRRASRRGAFVLMLHGIAGGRYPGVPSGAHPAMTAADLDDLLAFLASRFAFLSPEEVLAGRPGILLTFDDGFANNVENALPLLEAYRAPAIFFVTLQHILDPQDWLPAVRVGLGDFDLGQLDTAVRHDLFDGMSVAQLQDLARHPLATIGGHSVTHPFLTRVDDQTLAREVGGARAELAALCGQQVEWFAYPTGNYNRRVADAVAAAGYRAAVVEAPVAVGLPSFEIPRIGIYEPTPSLLEAKLCGLFRRPWRPLR
jgi:peptidoglycan/xylan/chitin deacetylase (PgdA/CDA1 family)